MMNARTLTLFLLPILAGCKDKGDDTGAPQCASIASATVSVSSADELEAALESAEEGDIIELEAGEYAGNFSVEVSNIALIGQCVDGVILQGGYSSPTVEVADVSGVSLSGFTVEGGVPGIDISGEDNETVTLSEIVIQNAGTYGLSATGAVSVVMTDVDVTATLTEGSSGTLGRGINLVGGVSAEMTGGTLTENAEVGILVSGSTLTASNVSISSTTTRQDGSLGRGVQIQEDATAMLSGLTIEGNHDAGICVLASNLTLLNSTIRNTQVAALPEEKEESGEGVAIFLGEGKSAADYDITLDGLTIEGNARAGLVVDGMTVQLSSTVISGNDFGAVSQNGGSLQDGGDNSDDDDQPDVTLKINDAPMD